MSMLTISNIQEYVPDVLDYGILDFTAEIQKTQSDIYRRLRVEWWPTWKANRYDIVVRGSSVEMDTDLLTDSQFTRAASYYCLAEHILPKFTTHAIEGDKFTEMIKFYSSKFENEFNMVLRDGVEYDYNDDGVVANNEKQPQYFMRLQR